MSKPRIVVGMSGGVDSSVVAAILKNQGYDVVGLTMRLSTSSSRCCSEEDVFDARRVAQALGIPHYVIPMHEPFREQVIDYFIKEYENGRTPNPCAVCNRTIKFGVLLDKALELGAGQIATGHYAMIDQDPETGRFQLRRGKESGKDQSYFLARLSQRALKHTLFPIGTYSKSEIRNMAEQHSLPVAQKSESQEVCFVPETGVAPYIEAQKGGPFPEGEIRNKAGHVLGMHRGIIGYTIGQRKGLGIALGKPAYVIGLDSKTNTVIVGDDIDLFHQAFVASDPVWVSIEALDQETRIHARIRYMHQPASATIQPLGEGKVKVTFDTPQRAITPGQLAVFYQEDRVLGSAWIDQTVDNDVSF